MRYYLILLVLLFAFTGWGQIELPNPREVDKEYRKEYRKEIKEYNRTEKRITEENWDVFLDKGESVPTDIISTEEFRAMSYSNWYSELVSPASVAADMVRAAKRKGIINVTDTGCDTDHPDLQKGKVKGSNYTADPCPDVNGHSTHVLGISYLICKPLIDAGYIEVKMSKFLGDRGQGSFAAITGGVDEETVYMKDNYLDYGKFAIANGSWGGGTGVYAPLKSALDKSKAAGVPWFFAAGNASGAVVFPGKISSVSAVSSLDQSLNISSFSCFGPEVDFSAGGRSIYSTLPGGRYGSLSGTSMATPAMTGVAAVAMCVYPNLTAGDLPEYLGSISKDLGEPGKDDLYGWGMAFVRAILDNPPNSQPTPPTCTDGKRNGKETGVDCGGPDCAPCPPSEPGKPPYRKTSREIVFTGKFPIGWFPFGNSVADANAEPVDWDMATVFHVSPAARKNIIVTRIGFVVDSETTYEWEYDALKANISKYFKNRAIGTPESWDFYHAGAYIPFFLDNHVAKGNPGFVKQLLTPSLLEFEVDGRFYTVAKEDLPGYNR